MTYMEHVADKSHSTCSQQSVVCMFCVVRIYISQTYLPEPLHYRMVGTVAVLVNSVLSPVVDVNVTQTTHEQLHGDREMIYNHLHAHRHGWRRGV